MNIKAERIEQLIQLVNRNLLLVASNQPEGLTPLELKRLQKVDAVIFGHDKFAYELVHFVANNSPKDPTDKSLASLWDQAFVSGLECLLVECAVIHDEVERDCFISRIYCWFTEKLLDRRDVPRQEQVELEGLRLSMRALAADNPHTVKALDSYSPDSNRKDPRKHLQEVLDTEGAQGLSPNRPDSFRLPALPSQKEKGGAIAQSLPLYVKHSQPSVLRSTNHFRSVFQESLPQIKGREGNYGLVHSQVQSEGERAMNELWLAKRRQEAFDMKAQQQLGVVMDRIALHKSRRESEALRRQESSSFLQERLRPRSANDASSPPRHSSPYRPTTSPRPEEGSQGQRQVRSIGMKMQGGGGEVTLHPAPKKHGEYTQTSFLYSSQDQEKEVKIVEASRSIVLKGTGSGSRRDSFKPMRFKLDLPDGYTAKSANYMQLSDSDDDVDPSPGNHVRVNNLNKKAKANKASSSNNKTEVQFKHDPPVNRERPQSAKILRTIATDDPELKVMYRFSNFRRMPLTSEQKDWLDNKEMKRVQSSTALREKLVAAVQAKGDKKKAKDAGKDKGGAKKESKKPNAKTLANNQDILKPKYRSASEFMSIHFPALEGNEEDVESMAPMRMLQLMEVSDVLDTFEKRDVPIRESVLRKALVVPQDKPEAICLEGLREGKEGLMTNPIPPEFWRKFTAGKGGKKGKKKGKK